MDDYIITQDLIDPIYKFYDTFKWRSSSQEFSFLKYCACSLIKPNNQKL